MLENVYPYITNDGSVGLYNADFEDIYHSMTGAYTEACEKFCIPADLTYYFSNQNEIKVLDICYGIGYNTKSFLHFYLNFLQPKNKLANICNDKIHSDNILCNSTCQTRKKNNNNVKNSKIKIDCIDTDKNLFFLSPFFLTNSKKIPSAQNLPTDKIKHYADKKIHKIYDFEKFINFILIDALQKNYSDFLPCKRLTEIFNNKKYSHLIDKNSRGYFEFLRNKTALNTPVSRIKAFVHNIYYHHISTCHKSAVNTVNKSQINVRYHDIDARKFIINQNELYDLIFLDAFTTNKCPCLWTLDFFKQLFTHLNDNGKILTYSNSALVRNAFLQAGFYVGKIYNKREGKFMGTIAAKNKSLIINELSEYDLNLLKTKAGIVYRDENLTDLNEAIIKRHEKEVKESSLMSSSKFVKQQKGGKNV